MADGFAFLWHSDPLGTASLGPAGGALGYGGIAPSVVVEFDTAPNIGESGDHVAITTNGDPTTALAQGFPAFDFADGVTKYAWIDYDATTTTLSPYLAQTSQRPETPRVSASVDLYAIVGPSAYLGFTAACGTASETHAILSLTIEYRP